MQSKNYDLKSMRIELIELLSATLKKDSKFYHADKEAIIVSVNRKTRRELIESIERQYAVRTITKKEIFAHCQL